MGKAALKQVSHSLLCSDSIFAKLTGEGSNPTLDIGLEPVQCDYVGPTPVTTLAYTQVVGGDSTVVCRMDFF